MYHVSATPPTVLKQSFWSFTGVLLMLWEYSCAFTEYWNYLFSLFIPRHTIVAGYYGFTLVVRESVHLSVRPSVFRFRMITWVNINGFSSNLVCALILWRSGLGLLMGKFRQFLTELSARDTPIFSFPDDNLSKRQWIFAKNCYMHWH